MYCRADTESTSEHLEALRKLSSDLQDQKATLEDLRDQRQAIMTRLSLLDKELVKQQVRRHSCRSLAVSIFSQWFHFCYAFSSRWVTWSSAGPSSKL